MNTDTTQRDIANEPQLPDDFPVILSAGELRKLAPGIQLLGPYPTETEATQVSKVFPNSIAVSDEDNDECEEL